VRNVGGRPDGGSQSSRWSVIARLLAELNLAGPAEFMPTIFRILQQEIQAVAVRLLFADVEERTLTVWAEHGTPFPPASRRAMIQGSPQGTAYVSGRTQTARVEFDPTILAPVIARSERIGVLEVRFGADPDAGSEDVVAAVGMLIGYIAIAAERWTDEFHLARRRRDMSLAAEVQWSSLPLAAFSSAHVSLAGALEPAYEIAGDLFDYACTPDRLWAGIFDAMGHGLTAARLSDLAVLAFRNARRSGRELQEQARHIHQSLVSLFDREGFVTGQLLSVLFEDPSASLLVNAGHPPPFLQRDGGEPKLMDLEVDYPFGIPFGRDFRVQRLDLRPGARLVLYSDGVVEARPDGGAPFGDARLAAALEQVRGLPPREAARRIIAAIRSHRAADLTDDATLLVLDVHGPPEAPRDAL
jgi:hypothetical protein